MPSVYAQPLNPNFREFDAAGAPLAGGKVDIYTAGTTTRVSSYPTYADAIAGTNANANPVILDASGRASIFLPSLASTTTYKMVVSDSSGVVQYTTDYVNPGGQRVDPRTVLSVYKNGTQTGFATVTKVTTWSVETDALSEWSAVNNRWVATYAGNYLVVCSAEMSDTVAHQQVSLLIYKNLTLFGGSIDFTDSTGGNHRSLHAQRVLTLAAGDYIEVKATGTANTSVYGATSAATCLTIARLP